MQVEAGRLLAFRENMRAADKALHHRAHQFGHVKDDARATRGNLRRVAAEHDGFAGPAVAVKQDRLVVERGETVPLRLGEFAPPRRHAVAFPAPLVFCPAAQEPAVQKPQRRLVPMRLRIFRRELLGLAEAFQRLRQATQLLKNEAAVVVGLGHVRTNRERALAAHERLLEAIELTQDVAASVQRIGVLRPDRQRRVVVRKRLRKAHEPVEHHGAVVERVGVRRADRQGAVEAFERLLRAQKIREHDAAIIVRLRVIGVDR